MTVPVKRQPVHGNEAEVPAVKRPGRVVRPFFGTAEGAERLSAGVVTFPPGDSIPHRHTTEEEVLYVASGRGALVCDGDPLQLKPGSFVFIPPGVEHFVRNDGDEPLKFFYAFSPPIVVGTW